MKKMFLFAIAFTVINSMNQLKAQTHHDMNSHADHKVQSVNSKKPVNEVKARIKVPANQVCMINNKFMSKEQIKVPFEGRTYYGCCEGCVTGLKSSAAARTSIDPLTKEIVDKSTAYIIIKPGSKDDVLYFKSEANAKKFLASK